MKAEDVKIGSLLFYNEDSPVLLVVNKVKSCGIGYNCWHVLSEEKICVLYEHSLPFYEVVK